MKPSAIGREERWLRGMALAVATLATFPVMLDATVLHLAVPALIKGLSPTAIELLWIVDIYPLVMTGLVLVTGPLGDSYGHKRMLVVGLVIFAAASLAAGLAASPMALIAARAGLALGGAMILPSSISIVRLSSEDQAFQAFAIGLWSSLASVCAAIGPLVGGVLLAHFQWGAVFLINVPIVAVTVLAAALLLRETPITATRAWDVAAALCLILGIAGLMLAVKLATREAAEFSRVSLSAAAGLAFLFAFKARQERLAQPMVDLELRFNPAVRFGFLSAMVPMGVLVGFYLLLALELQLVDGRDPIAAALFLVPMPVAMAASGIIAGHIMARTDAYRLAAVSLAICASGYATIVAAPFLAGLLGGREQLLILGLVLAGIGHGAVITVASTLIMTSADRANTGMLAAIESISYELGAALGVALLGSLAMGVFAYALDVPAEQAQAMGPEARHSIGHALEFAEHTAGAVSKTVRDAAMAAQSHAFNAAALVSAAVLAVLAVHAATARRFTR